MSDAAPRRLHPATVLLNIIRGAPSTLLGLPAIVAVSSRFDLRYVVLVALAATAVAGLLRWAAWRRFSYALTDHAVVIESGLVSRNRRTIPFDRVQDVAIEQGPLARVFGLAKVSLETGGADADEGALDSVSLGEAHRLRGVIRQQAVAVRNPTDAAPDAETAEQIVFAMPLGRVVLWGLFNFSLVWLAVIFGALQYVDNLLPFDVWDWLRDHRQVDARGVTRRAAIGAMLSLALVFALLGIVAGLLRTVLRDFGFTVRAADGRYRRTRGLFTRTEAVIALTRAQLALIESGWLRRALGWSSLKLQTLGGSDDTGGRQEVAPFARADEVAALLVPLGWKQPDPMQLRRVSGSHVWRSLLRAVGGPLVGIGVAGLFLPPVWFALIALLPVAAVALLRRRYHRYGLPAATLYVERGVLKRQTWIVPVA
ncbi:MAG: PH domain-containing protein, partial [Pseudomonadota bacterium]